MKTILMTLTLILVTGCAGTTANDLIRDIAANRITSEEEVRTRVGSECTLYKIKDDKCEDIAKAAVKYWKLKQAEGVSLDATALKQWAIRKLLD